MKVRLSAVKLVPKPRTFDRGSKKNCLIMAHQESHFSRESTKLNYFTNTELNLEKLYSKVCDYYISVTQDLDEKNIIDENTYAKYFNRNLNFTFRLSRTVVCNTC